MKPSTPQELAALVRKSFVGMSLVRGTRYEEELVESKAALDNLVLLYEAACHERDYLRARVAHLEEFWLSLDAQDSGVAEGPATEGRHPLPADADDVAPE